MQILQTIFYIINFFSRIDAMIQTIHSGIQKFDTNYAINLSHGPSFSAQVTATGRLLSRIGVYTFFSKHKVGIY